MSSPSQGLADPPQDSNVHIVMYVVLEAHHRFDSDTVADLWALIGRVYTTRPESENVIARPEMASIARITLAAWRRHASHMRQQRNEIEQPQWISDLCHNFDLPPVNSTLPTESPSLPLTPDTSMLLPVDFDFDVFDWSVWDDPALNAGLYATTT